MKCTLIKWKPLLQNYELVDSKNDKSYGHLPHARMISTLINVCLWLIIYVILKYHSPRFSAELFAVSVLAEGILRCCLLYIIAVLYVNFLNDDRASLE